MNYEQLKNSILQEAIEGRLVPQNPSDEPAAVLLQRIREEKARLVKEKKIKKDKNESTIYRNADGHWMERFEDKKRGEVCIDDEIPFEIPESWGWTRIGNVCVTTSGSTPLSNNSQYYQDGTIGWVRTTDLNNWKLTKAEIYITNKALEDYHLSILPINTLCIAMYGGAGTIGKNSLLKFNTTINQSVCGILPNENIDMEYIQYYIQYFRPRWMDYAAGSRKDPNINREIIKRCLFPLPPLSEQHRIVSRIEEIMPKVEEYGKAQERLDALNAKLPKDLKNSILQEAIEGRLVPQDPSDEPAAVLLQRIREEKARLVKEKKIKKDKNESIIYRNADGHWMERFEDKKRPEVCIDEEIPFEIPETWEWCRLGKIVNTHPGKTPPRGDMRYWSDGKYPWVSISDMKQDGIITDTKEKVSEYAATKAFGNKISKAGSLLMSFKLTIGRTCLLGIDAYHNEAIITIETLCDSNNYTRDYLSKILPVISNWGESKDAIKGSTLNAKSIYNLLIPLPPLSEQHRIVAQLESLLPKVSRLIP